MIKVALNLGGGRPLNNFPMVFEFDSAREWTSSMREESSILSVLDWAIAGGIYPISKMKIWAYVDDGDWFWEFEIALKNVREFEKYAQMEWEEINSVVEAYRRDKKIDEILDEDDD